MLTSEHEVWQRQRRFLAPMFSPKRTSTDYTAIMVEEAQAMVRRRSPVAAGQAVGADDLADLPSTLRAVREAMRLYPAAHSIGRSTTTDEVLQGYRIPAGSAVVLSPWEVHRSPKIWPDPDTFDPRRFDVPAGQFPGGHKYAWFPFGAGRAPVSACSWPCWRPRSCWPRSCRTTGCRPA